MQLEIGTIVEGKVIGITKFGAFVEIEKGVTGLIHISEISDSYVTDITDFINRGDIVKVKVLMADEGKISLSLKQANPVKPNPKLSENDSKNNKNGHSAGGSQNKKHHSAPQVYMGTPKPKEPQTFEDMLSLFKKSSEEKMSDIKRNMDNKRGSYSRKR